MIIEMDTCPRCDSTNLVVWRYDSKVQVVCNDCGLESDLFHNVEDAIADWNEKAMQTPN